LPVFLSSKSGIKMKMNTDHWSNDTPKGKLTENNFNYVIGKYLVSTSQKGRDSVIGIATGYGLGGPGIESRWGRDFPHPSKPALRPTQPPVHWAPVFSGGKGGRGVTLTTHPHLVPRS
jgi:hypothetical protein